MCACAHGKNARVDDFVNGGKILSLICSIIEFVLIFSSFIIIRWCRLIYFIPRLNHSSARPKTHS
jgi:hypothetical protein